MNVACRATHACTCVCVFHKCHVECHTCVYVCACKSVKLPSSCMNVSCICMNAACSATRAVHNVKVDACVVQSCSATHAVHKVPTLNARSIKDPIKRNKTNDQFESLDDFKYWIDS